MLVLVTPPSPGPRPLGCNSPGRLQAAYIFYRWLLGDQSCVMWTLLSLVLWWKWNVIGPFNLTSTMLILKVNPKRANSGHFKLTIYGLLRAINQTMEVGWGDWRLCSGTAGRGWSLISSLSQGLVFECYPNMDQGWPVASVWQAASPHRTASKHRMRVISAAGIELAHLCLKYKECMEDLCRHNISLTEGCAMILVSLH